ncbi:hypothetical protein [Marinobacter sp. P4B1]|uniref:hypothetical protein n=1 Tax=Marinobacter sp. P4B1 TaxID=1119533 RepID=UPI00071E4EA2|nr:hypothetical protein [Marinobacter sp. P4B1]KRW82300.1 hypothetical protein AQ621_11910 [Marinobacter sp. P4B1]
MQPILSISQWSNEALESGHDWVQRAFPTTQRSAVTGENHRLTESDVEQMAQDRDNMAKLSNNTNRFLTFMKSDPRAMTTGFNHNYQRVTRVIESLNLFGLEDAARAFYSELISAFRARQMAVPASDRDYWLPALYGNTSVRKKVGNTGKPPSTAIPDLYVFGEDSMGISMAHALGATVISSDNTVPQLLHSEALVLPIEADGEALAACSGDSLLRGGLDRVLDQAKERVQHRIGELFKTGQVPVGQGFVIELGSEDEKTAPGLPQCLIAIAVAPLLPDTSRSDVLNITQRAVAEILQLAVESGASAVYFPSNLINVFAPSAGSVEPVLDAFSAAYDEVDLQLYDRYGHRAP